MKALKIVGILLILAFSSNTVLVPVARYYRSSCSKIIHAVKKGSSMVILDDPSPDDSAGNAFSLARHHIKKLSKNTKADVGCLVLVTLDRFSNISTQTFKSSSDNLSEIFRPPRSIV